MTWAVRFTSNRKEGGYHTYEIVDDLRIVSDMAQARGANEVHARKVSGRSVAESLFKLSAEPNDH